MKGEPWVLVKAGEWMMMPVTKKQEVEGEGVELGEVFVWALRQPSNWTTNREVMLELLSPQDLRPGSPFGTHQPAVRTLSWETSGVRSPQRERERRWGPGWTFWRGVQEKELEEVTGSIHSDHLVQQECPQLGRSQRTEEWETVQEPPLSNVMPVMCVWMSAAQRLNQDLGPELYFLEPDREFSRGKKRENKVPRVWKYLVTLEIEKWEESQVEF